MLPKRTQTVTALVSRPEHTCEYKERPDEVSNAAHTAILRWPASVPSSGFGLAQVCCDVSRDEIARLT